MNTKSKKCTYLRIIPDFILGTQEEEIAKINKQLKMISSITMAFPTTTHSKGGYCIYIHLNKEKLINVLNILSSNGIRSCL